jgi:uncharacterized Fe-S cluster protein YjdI
MADLSAYGGMVRQFDFAHCKQAHHKWEGIKGRAKHFARRGEPCVRPDAGSVQECISRFARVDRRAKLLLRVY